MGGPSPKGREGDRTTDAYKLWGLPLYYQLSFQSRRNMTPLGLPFWMQEKSAITMAGSGKTRWQVQAE